ncbi:MAG: BrnT family toxin [Candidatus Margulisbacteria bacterium]|jgi:uncharacterized DUF497 family protein|nr:BrnT family toxin [Candidatus Margulisiibacteriota bacterium]
MYEFDRFEWDTNKAASNLAKHGFDFNDAWQVFTDSNNRTFECFGYAEQRFKTIGLCGRHLAAVVHTPRSGACRIISVRHVWQKERSIYYDNNS